MQQGERGGDTLLKNELHALVPFPLPKVSYMLLSPSLSQKNEILVPFPLSLSKERN
jgi:hypothetical protein